MKKLVGIVLVAVGTIAASAAQAAPTITVVPTLAPNIYGSPSFAGWEANEFEALKTGVSSYGTVGTPTYFQAQSNVTTAQAIVTGFPSWMGQADPGTVFGPAFANELGNRMTFGLAIDGNGSQFSISQLGFSAVSTDPGNQLNFGYGPGSYNYSTDYMGVLKGTDGILFTGDDVYVTSGLNTQMVDGLLGRGSGNSFAAYCTGCTLAQQQAEIDAAASDPSGPFTFTGTYTLDQVSGSATFNVSPSVPEPATWAMMIGGLGLVGASMRRRSRATSVATAFS